MPESDDPEDDRDDARYVAERERAYRGIAVGLALLAVTILLISIVAVVVVLLHTST